MCMFCLCSLVSRPPHLTGEAHLQHLSNQVDCHKAAGMEEDGTSGPSHQIVLWSVVHDCPWMLELSVH